jgi:hypothetical protein
MLEDWLIQNQRLAARRQSCRMWERSIQQNFSKMSAQEMTATLEPAVEEEADNIDFVELCEELEALERRINMQSRNIQNIKLEIGRGAYQLGEKLEEVGVEPT